MSALANVLWKNFNSKFTPKMIFRSGISFMTFADPDNGSIPPLHTLFVKHLYHILANFEQSRVVRIVDDLEHFGKNIDKILTQFWMTFL